VTLIAVIHQREKNNRLSSKQDNSVALSRCAASSEQAWPWLAGGNLVDSEGFNGLL
jgi:hypothetical protein